MTFSFWTRFTSNQSPGVEDTRRSAESSVPLCWTLLPQSHPNNSRRACAASNSPAFPFFRLLMLMYGFADVFE